MVKHSCGRTGCECQPVRRHRQSRSSVLQAVTRVQRISCELTAVVAALIARTAGFARRQAYAAGMYVPRVPGCGRSAGHYNYG